MSCEYCKNQAEFGYFDIHEAPWGYEIRGYGTDGCEVSETIDYCPHCGELLNNKPLTLDELKQMDGEPVWFQHLKIPQYSRWIIFNINATDALTDYEWTWLAYRQKIEE